MDGVGHVVLVYTESTPSVEKIRRPAPRPGDPNNCPDCERLVPCPGVIKVHHPFGRSMEGRMEAVCANVG